MAGYQSWVRKSAHIYCGFAGAHGAAFLQVSWWLETHFAARSWQDELGKTHLEVPGEVGLWQHLLCPTVPVPVLYPHLILLPRNTKRKLLFSHFKAEGNILYQRLDMCWIIWSYSYKLILCVDCDTGYSTTARTDSFLWRTDSLGLVLKSRSGALQWMHDNCHGTELQDFPAEILFSLLLLGHARRSPFGCVLKKCTLSGCFCECRNTSMSQWFPWNFLSLFTFWGISVIIIIIIKIAFLLPSFFPSLPNSFPFSLPFCTNKRKRTEHPCLVNSPPKHLPVTTV